MRFTDLQDQLKAEGISLEIKRGRFWRVIGAFAKPFAPDFDTDWMTTIGPKIGVPEYWETQDIEPRQLAGIAHERQHVMQFRWFGFGSAWLGVLPMAIVYVMLPLPAGLALGRLHLEWQAFLVGEADRVARGLKARPAKVALRMTSRTYGWPLPPFMRSWLARRFAVALAEKLAKERG